jgi:hypothetical protein
MDSDSCHWHRNKAYSSLLGLFALLFFMSAEPVEFISSVPLETKIVRIIGFATIWIVLVTIVLYQVNSRFKRNRFARLRKKVLAQRLTHLPGTQNI